MTYLEWLTLLTAILGGSLIGIGLTCWWFIREHKRLTRQKERTDTDGAAGFKLPPGTKMGGPGSLLP